MRHIQSFTNDAAIQDALDNKTLGKPYVALNNQTGTIDWNSKEAIPDYSSMYFTIEVISAGTVSLTLADGVSMQYSVDDGETWENNASINAQPGDKIMYKGINDNLAKLDSTTWDLIPSTFGNSTASLKVYGNIMSLIYGDNFASQTGFSFNSNYAFAGLFSGCTGLMNIDNFVLPATTLANACYKNMFEGCIGLTDVSNFVLPATTLGTNCYDSMFKGCTSLTAAPALPATTMADNCYHTMFAGCTSLAQAPELPATTLTQSCYRNMFSGCTSLAQAPELPATILTYGCYGSMFYGCTNLNYIKCLATDISAWSCLYDWVSGVASTGTFVKDPSMTGWTTGINGIPSGWTRVDAPVNTEGVWLKYDNIEISGTPENNSYRWSFDWEDGHLDFYIIENGNYLNLDAHICGYEYGCDSGMKGGEGGYDEDNQEWIECADKTGLRIITSYPLMEVTYTPGATPALYVETYNKDCTCEEQGLCDDGSGNCVECDPCAGWEGNGYESYEDCACQNYGEYCEEPEEEPEE